MTGEELAKRQLRYLQWVGFVAVALAFAGLPLAGMALLAKRAPALDLLPFAAFFLGSAYLGYRCALRHRRAVFGYIDRQLAIVTRRCREHGLRPLPEYQPPPALSERVVKDGEEVASAQRLVDGMLRHAGLSGALPVRLLPADPGRSIREILHGDRSGHAVGAYTRDSEGRGAIHLVPHARYRPRHVLCILCHETAHHFLYEHGIADSTPDDNEVQTELAAIYLGFGRFLTSGYACFHSRLGPICFRHRVGYLRPFVLRHAIRVMGAATAHSMAAITEST